MPRTDMSASELRVYAPSRPEPAFVDAVRAVEAARSHPAVDPERVAVTGASQGGRISIAVAGLVPDLAAVTPDVPFLAGFRRTVTNPCAEVERYLACHREQAETVFRTLHWLAATLTAAGQA